MIKITIFQQNHGEFLGWKSEGHSLTAPKGYDIICAGVSALLFSAYYQIKYNSSAPVTMEKWDGHMDVKLGHSTTVSNLAVQQMILGLEAIRANEGGSEVELRYVQSKDN